MKYFPIAMRVACWMAAFAVAGCRSMSPSQYTSPRVEGRVLDAETRLPIGGVAVRLVGDDAMVAPGEPPKGGQLVKQAPVVRTEMDGAFTLASERNLELFIRSGWYSVTVSFKQPGYASFTTNYTMGSAVLAPSGEPLVKAGDILLKPLLK